MKIIIFNDKNNFKNLNIEIPKFDELDDLKMFIGERLSTNTVMKDSYQFVYENIILTDCNKLIKYVNMRNYEQIRIGNLEDFLQSDDLIVELFVCEPISSLVHLIVKKKDRISVLKSVFNKFGLNFDYMWNVKEQKMKMDQFITDSDCHNDGYIKLIMNNDDTFTKCLNKHDQYLIEYYLRNNYLTYLWYRDEFNLSQINSFRQLLYQMKLALKPIDKITSLLSKDLPSMFMNSRFIFYEILTNQICEFCNDYYRESVIDKFGYDEIVINVCRQYFRDAIRVEIIGYVKSMRYGSNIVDKSIKRIATDALDYCLNYLIYPRIDWRYLMGVFIGEFSIGFVNDLFVDKIIDKWNESHSNITLKLGDYNNFQSSIKLSKIIDEKSTSSSEVLPRHFFLELKNSLEN